MSERTQLEWIYTPADFFEVAFRHEDGACDVLVNAGTVTVTLRTPQDPVASVVEGRITDLVKDLLSARQLQVHREFHLEGPRIYQFTGDKKHVSIRVGEGVLALTGHPPDIVVTDQSGVVLRDTKAERIAEEREVITLLTAKASQYPTVRAVLESHSRSVSDPDNELVHLYEIRDALSAHYGGEEKARQALKISKNEWHRLGILANVEALEQGRHRGKHPGGRRPATSAELGEAREITRRWIMAFARLV